MRIHILVVLMLAFSSTSFAACYTVYDKSDKPVYKSSEPPFDLSIPISEGIKSKYPGGYLIQTSDRWSCYLRSKKSEEAFKNRRVQLQSQGFSEVNDRIMILSFPKEVPVVTRPQNIPILPVTQDKMSIEEPMVGSIAPAQQNSIGVGLLNGSSVTSGTNIFGGQNFSDDTISRKNILGGQDYSDGYQTRDAYGNYKNSNDSYQTRDAFGNYKNSNDSYQTRDAFGNYRNSNDCFQTKDAYGNFQQSRGCSNQSK